MRAIVDLRSGASPVSSSPVWSTRRINSTTLLQRPPSPSFPKPKVSFPRSLSLSLPPLTLRNPNLLCNRRLKAYASFSEEDSVTRNPDSSPTVSSTRISPRVYISCLGTFVTGYNFGIVNVSLEFILKHLQLEKNTLLPGKILGSIIIAAAVGSCFSHLLVEKYGRKRILQLSAVPFLVGSLLSATAKNLMLVIMGQLSVGIGVGIVSATVPLYISEITPIELHGASGTVNQLLLWLGVLVGLLMGLPLSGNPEWWRIMFLATIFPTVGMVAGIINSPESPFWLIQQGNIPETEKAIEILWGKERVEEVLNTLTAIASANSGEPLDSWSILKML